MPLEGDGIGVIARDGARRATTIGKKVSSYTTSNDFFLAKLATCQREMLHVIDSLLRRKGGWGAAS